MEPELKVFVGVDWARGHHDVCAVDAQGRVLGERRLKHEGEELKKLCEWLATLGEPAQVAVGIETSHGPVVETLLERGFAVFALNPKQLDRFRDRFTVAGCKDDRLDARVLAESLRTDRARYRRLGLASPVEQQLRACSRLTEELQQERQRWLNRLGELLWRYFPALLELSEHLTTEWVLELCRLVPTPQRAQQVSLEQVAELLKAHRVRCIDAATVLERLRSQPLAIPEATVAACQVHVEVCLAQLELLTAQHKRALRRLDKLTAQLAQEQHKEKQRDVEILDSLPGVGRIVLATLCAEATEPLRERDYHALRALSGVAPVTRSTGKNCGPHTVHMRRACSGRLRNALFFWARAAVATDGPSQQKYAALRARGQGHAAALRRIADRLLFVTCTLLRTQSLYDPAYAARAQAPDEGRALARPSEGAPGVWGRSPHRKQPARSTASA
jgi:transposase